MRWEDLVARVGIIQLDLIKASRFTYKEITETDFLLTKDSYNIL